MLHITSFILSAFLAYTVYGWPPSTDLPPDDMPFSVCNLAESETQAISDTLKQIIQNDFNDENSAIAQLIKNACSTGKDQTSYEASQDTPAYSAKFTMFRFSDIQYGFCEQAAAKIIADCISGQGKSGGDVVTPFNSPGSGSHQDYKLRITPHEEPQPTPTPSEPPPTITALPQCSAVPDGFDQKNDLSIQAVLVSICAEDACDEIETERKTCRRRTRKNGFNIEAKLWQPWGSSFTSCKAVMKQLYDSCWVGQGQQGQIVVVPESNIYMGEIYSLNITKVT